MVSCQKGPTRHAYAWQIEPFWSDTLDITGYVQLVTLNLSSKLSLKSKPLCVHDNEHKYKSLWNTDDLIANYIRPFYVWKLTYKSQVFRTKEEAMQIALRHLACPLTKLVFTDAKTNSLINN